jgi:hypothetical protein
METKVETRTAPSEQDTIQTIAQVSPNFQITSDMLQMDEGHSPDTTEGSLIGRVGTGKDTNQGTVQASSQCHAGSEIACKDICGGIATYKEWKGSLGIGSQVGQDRNKGGKRTHRQVGVGIDSDVQPHPQQRTGSREKCRGEYQPHCTENQSVQVGDQGTKGKSQSHDSSLRSESRGKKKLHSKWKKWRNKQAQQHNCLTEPHSSRQRWKRMNRSNSGTRKKKDSMYPYKSSSKDIKQ